MKTLKLGMWALILAVGVSACGKGEIIPGREDAGKSDEGQKQEQEQEQEQPKDNNTPLLQEELARIDIVTDGGVEVNSKDSKDYRKCTVNGLRGQIRGRGNSTWEWYPKKPYRIKLDESAPFLGLPSNKDWVLLADYRDITHMMNATGFYLARELGLPFTNHARYATVTLNGKDLGLYMVTEQVEEGGNRVNLNKESGILLALDINDGPSDVPNATNNFYSDIFRMAAAVKYPKDATTAQRDLVKEEFAILEDAIDSMDWEEIVKLLDVNSMASYVLVQEIIGNVEMDNNPSLRSGYIHRYSSSSKWVMGPLWDCDGGFSYNWGDMFDYRGWGHTYFEDYRYLVFGSDPYNHRGAYESTASDFFCRLWGIPEFVRLIQSMWADNHAKLLTGLLDYLDAVEELIGDAAQKDMDLWGIDNYKHHTQVQAMYTWLLNRFDYLNGIINNYPAGTSSLPEGPSAKAEIKATVSFDTTYQQDGHYHGPYIELSDAQKKTIEDALGVKYGDLIYLYYDGALGFWAVEPDGSFNPQNTAIAPGHWFNAAGYVTPHGQDSYIFSEYIFDDGSYQDTFSLGKHPAITTPGKYTVSQAFVYGKKAVKFVFNITIT